MARLSNGFLLCGQPVPRMDVTTLGFAADCLSQHSNPTELWCEWTSLLRTSQAAIASLHSRLLCLMQYTRQHASDALGSPVRVLQGPYIDKVIGSQVRYIDVLLIAHRTGALSAISLRKNPSRTNDTEVEHAGTDQARAVANQTGSRGLTCTSYLRISGLKLLDPISRVCQPHRSERGRLEEPAELKSKRQRMQPE